MREAQQILRAVTSELAGDTDPALLAPLLLLFMDMHRPLADIAGAPLKVTTDMRGTLHHVTLWMFVETDDAEEDLVGQIELTFGNENGELNLDKINALPLFLTVGLNGPENTPEWVLRALHDRGYGMVNCDHCDERFATMQDGIEHEKAAHPVAAHPE